MLFRRPRVIDRTTAALFGVAGAAAFLWKAPHLAGLNEDEFAFVEVAEAGFFFLVSAAILLWSSSLHARHAGMLERAHASLAEALTQKQMFLDILSHDVKNPLAVARGRIELFFARHPGSGEELRAAERSLAQATEIIESSLDYSRLETESTIELKRVDLSSLAQQTLGNLAPLALEKGIELRLAAPARLLSTTSPLLVRALDNLVSNAIKWSPVGGEVAIEITPGGAFDRIAVVDHGPGVPPADRGKLFTRFARAEKGAVKGTGLGLAIVKRIAHAHGGRVAIEDTPGGGATFVLELPAGDPDRARAYATPQGSSAPNPAKLV